MTRATRSPISWSNHCLLRILSILYIDFVSISTSRLSRRFEEDQCPGRKTEQTLCKMKVGSKVRKEREHRQFY